MESAGWAKAGVRGWVVAGLWQVDVVYEALRLGPAAESRYLGFPVLTYAKQPGWRAKGAGRERLHASGRGRRKKILPAARAIALVCTPLLGRWPLLPGGALTHPKSLARLAKLQPRANPFSRTRQRAKGRSGALDCCPTDASHPPCSTRRASPCSGSRDLRPHTATQRWPIPFSVSAFISYICIGGLDIPLP